MTKRPQILSAATAITLLAFGGTATASDNDKLEFASEIKTCIAEVADHANYEAATYVRHTVINKRRSRRGYVFTIDTSVYADFNDDAIRKYASFCIARGENKLVKFTIDEVSG